MSCNRGDWTLRFVGVPGTDGDFEIRPHELSFTHSRQDLAYARGTFSTDLASSLKPHTRNADGQLRDPTLVELRNDGELVHTMYFDPSYAQYTDEATYIELDDAQKLLDSGVIDTSFASTTLRNAYEYIWERRENDDLLTEMRFAIPEEIQEHQIEGGGVILAEQGDTLNPFAAVNEIREIEQDSTRQLTGGYTAVNFDEVSPLQAFWELNELFGITTWADSNGTLWVGTPASMASYHVAAPDDQRVWRYSGESVSVRHPPEPIKAVTIKGPVVSNPGYGDEDDIISLFNPWSDDSEHSNVRATGVAFRPDIDYGRILTITDKDIKRDALEYTARSRMIEEMKSSYSGSIEILPDKSGDYTSLNSAAPGDILHLVPNDMHFHPAAISATTGEVGDEPDDLGSCTSFTNNELYLIDEVRHNVTKAGNWTMELQIGMYPDFPVETAMRFFNPRSEQYLDESDLYNDQQAFRAIESGRFWGDIDDREGDDDPLP